MRRSPITHELKLANPYFEDARDGVKRFEVRFDDRDFLVDDRVVLKQYAHHKLTGDKIERKITYVLRRCKGLMHGYVVLGME